MTTNTEIKQGAGELPQDDRMEIPHEHTADEDCNCEAVGYAKGWNAALAQRAASVPAVTCQIYGHVVGHCVECNVSDEGAAQDAVDTNKVLADNYLKSSAASVPAKRKSEVQELVDAGFFDVSYEEEDYKKFQEWMSEQLIAGNAVHPWTAWQAASVPAEAVQPVALKKLSKEEIQAIENKFNWHNARSCGTHIRFAYAMIEAMTAATVPQDIGIIMALEAALKASQTGYGSYGPTYSGHKLAESIHAILKFVSSPATVPQDIGRDAALVTSAQAALGVLQAFSSLSTTAKICAEELAKALDKSAANVSQAAPQTTEKP